MKDNNPAQTAFHIVWIIVGIVMLLFLLVLIYVAITLPDIISGAFDFNLPDFGTDISLIKI